MHLSCQRWGAAARKEKQQNEHPRSKQTPATAHVRNGRHPTVEFHEPKGLWRLWHAMASQAKGEVNAVDSQVSQ